MTKNKLFNLTVDIALIAVTAIGSFNNGWFNLANLVSWLGLIGVIGLAKKWQGNFIFNGLQNLSAAIVAGQNRVFGDMFVSLYYLATEFLGFKSWKDHSKDGNLQIDQTAEWQVIIFAIMVGFFALGAISWWLGGVYIFWDALNNATAIVAQYMQLVQRKRISWLLWLFTNLVSMGIFIATGTYQIAVMYAVFSLNAVRGWINWGESNG